MIGKCGEVFYVTDSEEEAKKTAPKSLKEQYEHQKRVREKEKEREREKERAAKTQRESVMAQTRQKEQEKQAHLAEISTFQEQKQAELEKKIKERGNKGGYLDGEDLNQAELEYLYDMMKHELQSKGENLFGDKGDHILQMFGKMYIKGHSGAMPSIEEFQAFMERITKMHSVHTHSS